MYKIPLMFSHVLQEFKTRARYFLDTYIIPTCLDTPDMN